MGKLAALSSAIGPTRSRAAFVARHRVRAGDGGAAPPDRISVLRLGALLHDVGKLVVPSAVFKRGPLTEEELGLMRDRRRTRMLLTPRPGDDPPPSHHHERWDERYGRDRHPRDDIPLEARVLCIADSFRRDDVDTPVPHAVGAEDDIEELARCAGFAVGPGAPPGRCQPRRPGVAGSCRELKPDVTLTAS